jgi:DMSO/TMAO reductase YedYZ molybdopterin-dependent catalytic subunit
MEKKPREIAKLLGMSVKEMLTGINNISIESLHELSKSNPTKYEIQIKGLVVKKLGLTVEELVECAEMKIYQE